MTHDSLPKISDFEGRRFLPNYLYARRGWMETDPTSSAVPDRSLTWIVVASPDATKLYLESLPDGIRYLLGPEGTQERLFFSYNYAPEIDPAKFPDEWASARFTGWEVLAEESRVVPGLLQLAAFNRYNRLQVQVEHMRSNGAMDLGKWMWRELMQKISRAKPGNEQPPLMKLIS